MTSTFSKKSFLCDLLAFLFLCPTLPSLLRFIGFDVYVVLSLLPAPPLPSHLPPVSRFCAHPFLSSHRFTIFEFALTERFKKWRTSRWRELKEVARAQHWCFVKFRFLFVSFCTVLLLFRILNSCFASKRNKRN